MGRLLLFTACFFAIGMLAAPNAKSGLLIPCTGEHVVLVKKLPREARIKTAQGFVHVDLGYKFSGCMDGGWVGYVENGHRYYKVAEPVLELLALRAGLNGLPSEPSYFFTLSASWPDWLWAGVFGFAAVGVLGRSAPSTPDASARVIPADIAVADASVIQTALGSPPGSTRPVIARDRPAPGRRDRAA